MNLQTLLENHYDALGGLNNILSVQTIHHVGTVTEKSGRVIAFKGWRKRPNLLRIEFSVNGITGREGYDGKRAWEAYPWKTEGPVYVSGVPEVSLRRGSEFDGHLINYAEKGHTAQLLDTDEFDSRPVYTVRVTLYDGNEKDYYIDRETFLVNASESVRPVHAGAESRTYTRYMAHQNVSGVLYASKWVEVAYEGEHQETFAWDSITTNLPLSDDFFEKPD